MGNKKSNMKDEQSKWFIYKREIPNSIYAMVAVASHRFVGKYISNIEHCVTVIIINSIIFTQTVWRVLINLCSTKLWFCHWFNQFVYPFNWLLQSICDMNIEWMARSRINLLCQIFTEWLSRTASAKQCGNFFSFVNAEEFDTISVKMNSAFV